MKKINIGIVGLGRMGITHFSILNYRSDVRIVAVSDTSSLVLNWFLKYVKDVKVFEDYQDMINRDLIDAVLVCTPPLFHYPVIKLAGERGIHVFAEKPFTLSHHDAGILAETFVQNRLHNQVGYVNRFNDIFCKTKDLLKHNIIGSVYDFNSEICSYTVKRRPVGKSWRDSAGEGGGVVFEMASHAIDLANYFFGKPVEVSNPEFLRIFSKNVPDLFSVEIKYGTGISGRIHANWSDPEYRKPINNISIKGSLGELKADQYSIQVFLKQENQSLRLAKGLNTIYVTDVFNPVPFYVRGNEFTSQLYDFIGLINGEKTGCICSFMDALDTLEVIEKAQKKSVNM